MTIAYVVTTINAPNQVLRSIAEGCQRIAAPFIVVGDAKTPEGFALDGATYLDLQRQVDSGFGYARQCPVGHYARKNIGYLEAVRMGADVIRETDDDNHPRPSFFEAPKLVHRARVLSGTEWINVYRYFTDRLVWPRGFPLDEVQAAVPELPQDTIQVAAPIQQGLADENPDVDAIFRLVHSLPLHFNEGDPLALSTGSWCPFNSQNTTYFEVAFPLLYLPALCSFRMTDIWRSFVAIRISHANGWPILFHSASVRQERNEHNLMRDFEDEIDGYRHNRKIVEKLKATSVNAGPANVPEGMRACYLGLVDGGFLPAGELDLLDSWLADLAALFAGRTEAKGSIVRSDARIAARGS